MYILYFSLVCLDELVPFKSAILSLSFCIIDSFCGSWKMDEMYKMSKRSD